GLVVDNKGTGDLFTASSSGASRFVITQAGNVGVGTTTPSQLVDIEGGALKISGSTNGSFNRLYLDKNSASEKSSQIEFTQQGSNLFGLGVDPGSINQNNFSLYDELAGAFRFFIDSSGKTTFGNIGGSIPTILSTFDIRSQSNSISTASVSGATSFAALVTDNSGPGDLFAASSSGLNRFVITQNGNVGIGDNTPSARLDVEGGNIMIGQQTNTSVASNMAWTDQASGCTGACVPGTFNSTTTIASVSASVVYNGSLYIGTWKSNSAEVYRYNGTTGSWTAINTTAGTFDNVTTSIDAVTSMIVYNGYLYIGTTESTKGQVLRYNGGTGAAVFSQVSNAAGQLSAAGASSINGVTAMTVFQGKLWAGTSKPGLAELDVYQGGSSWSFASGGTGTVCGGTAGGDTVTALGVSQTQIFAAFSEKNLALLCVGVQGTNSSLSEINTAPGTFTTRDSGGTTLSTGIQAITSIVNFNGQVYLGVKKQGASGDLYRYETALGYVHADFVRVNNSAGNINGGATTMDSVSSLAVYNGKLYVGTERANAAEIYRYENGEGTTSVWTKVSQSAAGTIGPSSNTSQATAIDMVSNLIPYNGSLFAGTYEPSKAEVYSSTVASDQSYALQFHAGATPGGGEQNSLLNIGSISFVASPSGMNQTGGNNTGEFLFSHTIATNNGAYDVAEDYGTRDDSLEAGDVVAMDSNEQQMVKKAGKSDSVVGIYSENPGFRLSQQDTNINGGRAVPIALAGRVPVKVSTENGPIHIGDLLTQSSKVGVAMKATKPGFMVARAFADYENSDKTAVGKIMAFVNLTWADPGVQLTSSGNLNIASTLPTDITTPITQTILGDSTASSSASGSATMTDSLSQLGATVSLLQTQYASLSAEMNKITKVDDLSERIAALEKNMPLFSASSSGSILGDATISGQLSVIGKTLLSDVGITGKVTMGLLTIDGLNENDTTPAASINTTGGPLKLQSLALNGIDILHGKIIIDTDGNMKTAANITAKKYNVDIEDIKSASLGEATIQAGESEVDIPTTTVTKDSKIFVTAESLITQPLIVTSKKAGKSFTVQMASPAITDVKFNWWIVN
ncbi:MAG TPA: hypothetical protein VLF89_00220, partial [Candidatus Saccharimonadales bacterium]|nr:hypothetical protein [Candidatus Saccharimonadales bacterium]